MFLSHFNITCLWMGRFISEASIFNMGWCVFLWHDHISFICLILKLFLLYLYLFIIIWSQVFWYFQLHCFCSRWFSIFHVFCINFRTLCMCVCVWKMSQGFTEYIDHFRQNCHFHKIDSTEPSLSLNVLSKTSDVLKCSL